MGVILKNQDISIGKFVPATQSLQGVKKGMVIYMKRKNRLCSDNAGFGVVEVVLIIVVVIALVIIFNNQIKTFLEFALGSLQPAAEDLLDSAPEVS